MDWDIVPLTDAEKSYINRLHELASETERCVDTALGIGFAACAAAGVAFGITPLRGLLGDWAAPSAFAIGCGVGYAAWFLNLRAKSRLTSQAYHEYLAQPGGQAIVRRNACNAWKAYYQPVAARLGQLNDPRWAVTETQF